MKRISVIIIAIAFVIFIGGVVVVNAIDNKKINILIYGLDGNGTQSERSDAIMLVNYNFDNNDMVITSIPRDSYVEITCKNNKYDKINHSYAYGGKKCLNDTVSKLFEINNVKNIVFDFKSVIELIDYFGLIELTPSYSFCQIDELGVRTYCFEKDKKIQIDGRQTLAYMRARKKLPNGDFDRIKNQRQVLKIILNKFLNLSLAGKIKFYNYFRNVVETDIKLKDLNIKKLINVKQINLDEYTLKGEDYINIYYYYRLDLKYLEKIKKYYI